MQGIEHALLRSPGTSPLDNKNEEVNKARVATGVIVTPAVTRKNLATFISSIEPFNLKLWNKDQNRYWMMYLGDISYGLGTQYNNSVVDTFFSDIYQVTLLAKKRTK